MTARKPKRPAARAEAIARAPAATAVGSHGAEGAPPPPRLEALQRHEQAGARDRAGADASAQPDDPIAGGATAIGLDREPRERLGTHDVRQLDRAAVGEREVREAHVAARPGRKRVGEATVRAGAHAGTRDPVAADDPPCGAQARIGDAGAGGIREAPDDRDATAGPDVDAPDHAAVGAPEGGLDASVRGGVAAVGDVARQLAEGVDDALDPAGTGRVSPAAGALVRGLGRTGRSCDQPRRRRSGSDALRAVAAPLPFSAVTSTPCGGRRPRR